MKSSSVGQIRNLFSSLKTSPLTGHVICKNFYSFDYQKDMVMHSLKKRTSTSEKNNKILKETNVCPYFLPFYLN